MKTTVACLIPVAAVLVGALAVAAPAGAQTGTSGRNVCVAIDEARDTLSPQERTAARLLVEKQFTAEGWHIVPEGCQAQYLISHIRLGERITATLSGPEGWREGSTLGLDDLPALYSQMVRSIVTGRPMEGMNVIDRENVTSLQSLPPKRMASESFSYARLGYGSAGPGMGFGHRTEGDGIALDVSFMNFQMASGRSAGYYGSDGSASFSWVKLEALHFTNRVANASPYVGGGLSWGGAYASDSNYTSWEGSGLQGELTAGYEVGRASTLRMFVEADATLPFYSLTSSRAGGSRYNSSFVIAVGLGWQRGRK